MLSIPAPTSVVADSDSGSFCKDGRIIRVGDCALFKPAQDSPPLIGIIRDFSSHKEENIKLNVNWIYRPADVELEKGILLEAAPNEVFFSFHKEKIPAASLLHPCKVSFLSQGVELPSRIASFVCRRVYDIENKCLRWLKDKYYINKEEVYKLLVKTRLEMHGAVQSGGRSPKPLNVQASKPQLKSGSDSIKNSNTSSSSLVKGKKRERGDPGSNPIKHESNSKTSDNGSENMLTSQIAKITHGGGLVDFEGVWKLVQLMRPEGAEMKVDLVGRIMLVDVLSVTENFDCLGHFVQLTGLLLLDEWLQEVRRGKFDVGSNTNERGKSVDDFLLATLRALDKLPVNLNSLQTSNVGKSVNYLRSHTNPEIQRKARSLVDTWKKRVEAEMNVIDAKSGLNQSVSSTSMPVPLEVSFVGGGKTGGPSEAVVKSSIQQPSAPKSPGVNLSHADDVSKFPVTGSVNKLSTSASLHRKSSNGTIGPATSEIQKEPGVGKVNRSNRNVILEEGLADEEKHEEASGTPLMDHGPTQKLIVRLPNTARSPSQCASEGSVEEPSITLCKASPFGNSERQEHCDKKVRARVPSEQVTSMLNAELPKNKDGVAEGDKGYVSPTAAAASLDEQPSASADCERVNETSKAVLSSETALESGKPYEASFSCINALVDSCVKISEGMACLSDDVGMNLLASVAAGEISKLDTVSPLRSGGSTPSPEDICSGSEVKSRQSGRDITHLQCQLIGGATQKAVREKEKSVDSILHKNVIQLPLISALTNASGDGKDVLSSIEERRGEICAQIKSSINHRQQSAHTSCLASGGNHSEVTYDASGYLSSIGETKECCTEDETSYHLKGKIYIGQREVSNEGINEATFDLKSPSVEDEKSNHADFSVVKNHVVAGVEAASENVKLDTIVIEVVPGSSFTVNGEAKSHMDNKQPFIKQNCFESIDENSKVDGVSMKMESLYEKGKNLKTEGYTREEEKPNKDKCSVANHDDDCAENLDRKVASPHLYGVSKLEASEEVSVQETEQLLKSSGCKLDAFEGNTTDEQHASCVNTCPSSAAGSEVVLKLDFDLNEGFPADDESQEENISLPVPGSSPPLHLSCPLPFPISSISESKPTSITVAAAAKGPFVYPENLSRIKGELGWKGSAATSAFRPAEPRKVLELPLNTTSTTNKHTRPPLDIDLNMSDEKVLDDLVSSHSAKRLPTELRHCAHGSGPAGGLDFDLNSVGECPDTIQFAVNTRSNLENLLLLSRSSLPDGFSDGKMSTSRNFDLNGPGADDVATETAPLGQNIRSIGSFPSNIPGMTMNHAKLGNISSWLPPGNSYSTFPHPSFLPSRGEQGYPVVSVAGPPRMLVPSINATGPSFGSEMFRGAVLSSSPALVFPPSSTFPYPGYPFGTSFPVASNPYMDSSSGGAVCFPAIPSQLEGSTNVVPSHYPQPYLVGQPGTTASNGLEYSQSLKWGNQGLDLNTGPGSTNIERRDVRLSPALRQVSVGSPAQVNKHLHMYQMTGGGLKRKEPDGGWDLSADTNRYKHP